MKLNKGGLFLKTMFIVLGAIILVMGVLFYFFGQSLPIPGIFGWGHVYYNCITKTCQELADKQLCESAVLTAYPFSCVWIGNLCNAGICESYESQELCINSPLRLNCVWLNERCQKRNYSPQLLDLNKKKDYSKDCRKYQYDYVACINEMDNSECKWTDNPSAYYFGSPCIKKTCSDYNQKKSCLTTRKELNCDWIGNKCRPRGEFLCRELKSLQCNNYPLCKWQKVYSFPGLKLF